ncbi:MAG: dihydrofolate reductase [Alphaproteobacteria bacterium]
MAVILIAACAGKKQVIGDHGKLPWHFPSDLKFFKQTTLGHAVVMGRKTYDSIIAQFGRPLPGRRHLVVTRDPAYQPPGAPEGTQVFHDIPSALAAAPPGEDVFIVGGQQIFEQTLDRADRVLLTHIDKDYEGDAFFPPLDPAVWRLAEEKQLTEKDTLLRFCVYERFSQIPS